MDDPRNQDAIDALIADHREVLDLVAQIPDTTDPARRRELADQLVGQLVPHLIAAETHVFPAVREHLQDGDAAARENAHDQQQLELTMKEIEDLQGDDPHFLTATGRLEEQLREHVRREEEKQFPQLRTSMTRDELVELGQQVERAKRSAPTRPHPNRPHSPNVHKLVEPGAGLVDKVRDAFSGRSGRG